MNPSAPVLARPYLVLTLLAACSCAAFDTGRKPYAVADDDPFSAPALERSIRIYDPKAREELTLDALLAEIVDRNVVFLGETHTDETTHRFQTEILRRLHAARGGKVILAMEQFERDAQDALDRYLSGAIDEATFKRTTPGLWSNYDTDYRPMIEFAKANGVKVVASNAASSVRRKLGREGKKAFDALTPEERKQIASELLPETDAYWSRVDAATRGHGAMGVADASDRLYSGQSVWDNTMAESIALALDAHPDHCVIHVNGGFHSAYFDGTVAQLEKRKPGLKVATIAIDAVTDLALSSPPTDDKIASYVVHAAAIAQSERDDTYQVAISSNANYRLSKPAVARGLPLVVHLPEPGVSAEESQSLLQAWLGDEAVIAVLEPLSAETASDGGPSGRFGSGDFGEAVGTVHSALHGAAAYLVRNYELDAKRVVLSGAGETANYAAAILLHSRRAFHAAVVGGDASPQRLAELSFPDTSDAQNTKARSLAVLTTSRAAAWKDVTGDWKDALIEVAIDESVGSDPWLAALATENALRRALGLKERTAGTERRHVVLDAVTPRARTWALRAARKLAPDALVAVLSRAEASTRGEELSHSQPLEFTATATRFAQPGALPMAPGPFGGTTIVVLPANIDAAERDAWIALEQNDPLTKHSRFHRLRVATADGERALPAVLEKLKGENRKNVLIVPAQFCADGKTMTELREAVSTFASEMTIAWSPGLGSRWPSDPKP